MNVAPSEGRHGQLLQDFPGPAPTVAVGHGAHASIIYGPGR